MSELHIYNDNWPYMEEVCPCDAHLMDFIAERNIRDATIYHFGTGGHHLVGLRCLADGRNNSVFGITASPAEYEEYIKLLITQPKLAKPYLAYFGDIYMLNEKLLPEFDVVSMFHSREFRTDKNDAYGAWTDLETMKIMTRKTRPGGFILFYTRSQAYGSAMQDIEALVQTGAVKEAGAFKTLRVFERTAVAV